MPQRGGVQGVYGLCTAITPRFLSFRRNRNRAAELAQDRVGAVATARIGFAP